MFPAVRSPINIPVQHALRAGALVLALAAVALHSTPAAHAGWGWCWDDPLVQIDGSIVDIRVGLMGSPADIRGTVSLATITIHVAPGTAATVLAAPPARYVPETTVWKYDGHRAADGSQVVSVEVAFTSTGRATFPAGISVFAVSPGAATPITTLTASGASAGVVHASLTVPGPLHLNAPGKK